ncbi:MAG: CpsD/CapB family tyrosine-protein kinase [Planctomycetota bacterium]
MSMRLFGKRGDEPDPPALPEDLVVVVDRAINPYLVSFHDPTGFRAEQVRGLRNKLMAMNPEGLARTLVVSSAMRGEGKSVTSINLAIAFAEQERNPVLLVDADLRSPSVQKYLNLNVRRGLADVLLGRVALDDAVQSSGVRNLFVLGAGRALSRPSEILTPQRLEALFDAFKERYQYTIIDTPPVLPATDASVIAARADGTLLVVRMEHSAKSQTKQALRQLQDLGANVLGSFATQVRGVDPDRMGYAYPGEGEGDGA